VTHALEKINEALALVGRIRGEIALCDSLAGAALLASSARAVADLLAECGAACELRLQAAETYILAETNLGWWLKATTKQRQARKSVRTRSTDKPTCRDLGITEPRADRCRRLASANGQLQHTIDKVRTAIYEKAHQRPSEARALREGDLRPMTVAGVLRVLEEREVKERSVLRPSDLWVFNPPRYGRIDDAESHGYLPGDVYCNIFWQWARQGELVAEVMAGSGMIQYVYERRSEWLPAGASLDLDLRLFDLAPRGPYKIVHHDARQPLSVQPGLIVMDVPYFGIVRGAYGLSADDIANACDPEDWLTMLGKVAHASYTSQAPGGRCCVIVASAYLDTATGERFQAGMALLSIFANAGYSLVDRAHFGRAIQATGGRKMRFVNADAVRKRWLLSEMTDVWLFMK
jgi:hypothetical protein